MDYSKTIQVEGGVPLVGNIKISGSRALAVKLIYASILSGETCTLYNVPKAEYVLDDLALIQALGVKATWGGNNKLTINSQDLNSYVVPKGVETESTTVAFIVPALVHKFGKATLPKGAKGDQYAKIWQSFGMEVTQDFDNYYIESVKLKSGEVALPYKSRVLTDISIITALFILGKRVILNASTDIETDDLIDFCNKIGGEVSRQDDGSIVVNGCGVFRSVGYTLPYDREEAGFFIVATLLTHGNTKLLDIERARLLPFINWLSKIGANYEFSGSDMRIWHNSGNDFLPSDIHVLPHPGFMTDFAPFAVFLSCFAQGESLVVEKLPISNLEYISDLNRLGANINVTEEVDDINIKIRGLAKLRSGKIALVRLKYGLVSLLYALSIEGKNEIEGFEIIENGFENILDRLKSLGAVVQVPENSTQTD